MKTAQFDTPGPLWVQIRNPAGSVRLVNHGEPVTAVEIRVRDRRIDDQSATEILERVRVACTERQGGQQVVVEVPERHQDRPWFSWGSDDHVALSIEVRVPPGAHVDVSAASASVELVGRYGDASVHTASGNVALEQIDGQLAVHTASGSVRVDRVGASGSVQTASGSVTVGSAGSTLEVKTASGGVAVGDVSDALGVTSASGSVAVGTVKGHLEVKSASGSVAVGEAGRGLEVNAVSGSVEIGTAEGDCHIETASGGQRFKRLGTGRARLRSVSGRIVVGVAPGIAVRVDVQTLSGPISSEIEISADDIEGDSDDDADAGDEAVGVCEGAQLDLRVNTVSGGVKLLRA